MVYGMANVAVELGAVEHTGTPAEIAGIVLHGLAAASGPTRPPGSSLDLVPLSTRTVSRCWATAAGN